MAIVVNKQTQITWEIDADAPEPIEIWEDDSLGQPVTRLSSLICEIKNAGTVVTKTVSNGITLSNVHPLTGAIFAGTPFVKLQLTSAELATYRRGRLTQIEFREGSSDPKTLVLKGWIDLK